MSVCIEPWDIAIPLPEIAKSMGWSTQRTARRFSKCGWAWQINGSGSWYCLQSVFQANLPRYYLIWIEMRDAGAFKYPGRARYGNRNAVKPDKRAVSMSRQEAAKLVPKGPCSMCGCEHGRDVHHKDENPLNNDLANLVRLCRRCHIHTHMQSPKNSTNATLSHDQSP